MLSQLQRSLYWRTWSATIKALRRLGHQGTDDELRHWIHGLALGNDKSMTAFTNTDFDAFLAVCAGYTRMGDLEYQLAMQDMPKTRVMMIAHDLLIAAGVDEPGREQYVRAIYKRIQAKRATFGEVVYELEQIPDSDIVLVVSALLHTVQHKRRVDHNHPRSGRSAQTRWHHRVGARADQLDLPRLAADHVDAPAPGAAEPHYAGPARPDDPF